MSKTRKRETKHVKYIPVGHKYVEWRILTGKSGVRKQTKQKLLKEMNEGSLDY